MALCNIVGDCCYLGFAFATNGFVSFPKLIGACFAMLAHIFLLAYGDEQARMVANEHGKLARIFFALRQSAQQVVRVLPTGLQRAVHHRPIGIPFFMLAMNGLGLLIDGFLRFTRDLSFAMADQTILGLCVLIGTGAFAIADFVRAQRMADFLTKVGPSVLMGATVLSGLLAASTRNPFVIVSVVAFTVTNFAGFFTRIDKEKGQHLHS